jgi:predicted MFS family arabinose efflux permease
MTDNAPMTDRSAAEAPLLPRADATIILLSCAAFCSGAGLRICDALLPRIAHDFDRTTGAAGQVIISFSVAYGLMQLLFGPLGDRYGKARLVYVALFGCAAGALASAFAPGFEPLLWTRAAWGMSAAGVIPLAMAWIGDTVPYEERQATLARLLTGTLSGMMAGQLGGGLFADSALGWRGAFLALGAAYGVVALLLLIRVRSTRRPYCHLHTRALVSLRSCAPCFKYRGPARCCLRCWSKAPSCSGRSRICLRMCTCASACHSPHRRH